MGRNRTKYSLPNDWSVWHSQAKRVALWCVYPIAYLFPIIGGEFFGGASGFVLRQAGYSIADILAKAAYGLAIYKIARVKSGIEDSRYDDDEVSAPLPRNLPGRTPAAA